MNVKGFILEDDQGRQFVMVCEQQHAGRAKMFELRGWQRRRLVPLQYPEQERRQLVDEALLTLNNLFASPPRLLADMQGGSSDKSAPVTQVLGTTRLAEGDHGVN